MSTSGFYVIFINISNPSRDAPRGSTTPSKYNDNVKNTFVYFFNVFKTFYLYQKYSNIDNNEKISCIWYFCICLYISKVRRRPRHARGARARGRKRSRRPPPRSRSKERRVESSQLFHLNLLYTTLFSSQGTHARTCTRTPARIHARERVFARGRARERERGGGLFGCGGRVSPWFVGERRGSAGASDRPRFLALRVRRSFRFVVLARARGLVAERGGSGRSTGASVWHPATSVSCPRMITYPGTLR